MGNANYKSVMFEKKLREQYTYDIIFEGKEYSFKIRKKFMELKDRELKEKKL